MELKTPLREFISPSDPIRFAREHLGFTPDAIQARVLTVSAQPESLTVIVAPEDIRPSYSGDGGLKWIGALSSSKPRCS